MNCCFLVTGTFLQTLSPARAESVTVTMTWTNNDGYYPSPSDSSISCSQGNYIEIINMYGRSTWLNTNVNVTLYERFLLKQTCNCNTTCDIPVLRLKKTNVILLLLADWNWHIEYSCISKSSF